MMMIEVIELEFESMDWNERIDECMEVLIWGGIWGGPNLGFFWAFFGGRGPGPKSGFWGFWGF